MLEIMVGAAYSSLILSNRKAIRALFPYAIRLGQRGDEGMISTLLSAARTSGPGGFIWHRAGPYIAELFNEPTPHPSEIIAPASHYALWNGKLLDTQAVSRWAEAVSAIPYSEEVGQSVAYTLLQIASIGSLRPHISNNVWTWLKRLPLSPCCQGRLRGTKLDLVRCVRGLEDIGILKSYYLLVRSGWYYPTHPGSMEMQVSTREEFGGIGTVCDREDLIAHLDHVLGELGQGFEYLQQYNRGSKRTTPFRRRSGVKS